VRHLLLTHIHLDHAGGAGVLVRQHPGLQVHVSPVGAPHLVDPSRLDRSARRIYGDDFDRLWGELAPVPAENVHETGDDVVGLASFPTPGHASHHVSYFHRDGTLYTGDAAGVRIQPQRHILPVAPPPDIDVEAWHTSIDELEARQAARLALIHFGVAEDVADHLQRLRRELDRWAAWVGDGMTAGEFAARVRADLERDADGDVPYYEQAAPVGSSWDGLRRYWDKRREE
jgi:glyoxylase-like metal-dependent hydrolase (beta-lactamase superfamily II)